MLDQKMKNTKYINAKKNIRRKYDIVLELLENCNNDDEIKTPEFKQHKGQRAIKMQVRIIMTSKMFVFIGES